CRHPPPRRRRASKPRRDLRRAQAPVVPPPHAPTRQTMRTHHLIARLLVSLSLMLMLTTSSATSSAQSATAGSSACVPAEYRAACEGYAVAMRAAQRDLDAGSGALSERRAQIVEALSAHEADRVALERSVRDAEGRARELEDAPGLWTGVALGSGATLALVIVLALVTR